MSTNTRITHANLLLRVTLGTVFVAHAGAKLISYTLPDTVAFFAAYAFPSWSAYLVFLLELVGGAALCWESRRAGSPWLWIRSWWARSRSTGPTAGGLTRAAGAEAGTNGARLRHTIPCHDYCCHV